MTRAQLAEQRAKILNGLAEARLQVARFEGALEMLDYLLSNAPAEASNENHAGIPSADNGGNNGSK